MSRAKVLAMAALLCTAFAAASTASEVLSEHVTGGQLDLSWIGGFDTPNAMYGKTLESSDPAYANPSGDHTVAVAQSSMAPDSGGIICTVTDPGSVTADVAWEGWMFTGSGDTRRGLVVRATPGNNYKSFYMFVIEPGLAKLRFRKIIDSTPTTLKEWLVFTTLPAGVIPSNTWHHLKVIAEGTSFRFFFDGFELPGGPYADGNIAAGAVGCYSFRFDLGNVPVYFDDLVLSCLSEVTATLDVKPHHLNLGSKGKWITAYVTAPAPHLASEIDVASLRLNGVPAATDPEPKLEDHDTRLKVKFPRAAFAATLEAGDAVPVTLSGAVGQSCMTATDVLEVKAPKVHAPHHGDHLVAGQVADVTWDVDAEAQSMSLMLSTDDGETWSVAAPSVPNTGIYRWQVPPVSTDQARIALVSVYDTDETGVVNQSEYAASDAFSIDAALAVTPGGAEFSLRAANPVAGPFAVSFSLATAERARIDVFDVAGRAIVSREVGGRAGTQRTTFAAMPAGQYIVRLSQSGRTLTSRVTVMR